jgi:hypothetical protein
MSNKDIAEVGCLLVGECVDEAELPSDFVCHRGEVVRTHVNAGYADVCESAGASRYVSRTRKPAVSIESVLNEILAIYALNVPKKDVDPETIRRVFADEFGETAVAWLLRCYHEKNAPVSDEKIRGVEKALNIEVPHGYQEFLRMCDGAKLFIVSRKGKHELFPDSRHIRYHLFGVRELVEMNRKLFDEFRTFLGTDPAYKDMLKSNYLAFCDVADGNFLSILLEGKDQGKVFLMNHEYYYCPYSVEVSDLNYTLAPSFEDWLKLVVQTGGWGGRGHMMSGL